MYSLHSPASVGGGPPRSPCSSPRPLLIPHTHFSGLSGATWLGFQAQGAKLVHPWLLGCFGGKLHLRMLKTTSIVLPKASDSGFSSDRQLNFVSTSHPVQGAGGLLQGQLCARTPVPGLLRELRARARERIWTPRSV